MNEFVTRLISITLLFPLLITGCSTKHASTEIFPSRISVNGDRFIDNLGRQVVLNGINVVNKSKEDQYLFDGGPEFYANLKEWGFNSIRFIIIWDGLEPEPGVYDQEYLGEIEKRLQWAGDQGLFVVLDMHQDLYSVKYSDGAPEWATLDEGETHVTGAVWSDSYMLSGAVQTAFDNFWLNKPASDGVGLQDHYAATWKMVAERFSNNETIIGFDLMNEPFPGTFAMGGLPAFLEAYGKLVYEQTGQIMSEEELAATWGSADGRAGALEMLSSAEKYAGVVDAIYPFSSRFESEYLQPMYQKVSEAIRSVDSSHVLFLEHNYYGNLGVKSTIKRTLDPSDQPDALTAYAPHAYDLVTDTENASAASSERLKLIYERIGKKGKQEGMPVWMGEWGAYYNHDGIVTVAKNAVGLTEDLLFGHAYWSYDPGSEKLDYFQQALIRPYPAFINGDLIRYKFNHETSQLLVEWKEDPANDSPTVIYTPWISRLQKTELENKLAYEILNINQTDAGWIVIHSIGSSNPRELLLSFADS